MGHERMGRFMKQNEYFISPDTMFIAPTFNENGYLHSKVTEVYTEFEVKKKPSAVVHESCGYYGSSFQGRADATTQITGFKSKVPLCISEYLKIFFFPLESPKNEECVWVSLNHVDRVIAVGSDKSTIVFSNGKAVQVPYSKGTIERNLGRTAYYRLVLMRRVGE
jgi:competence protein ComK